ncbi:hypothetical protein [Kitasatospora sp. NPDC096140]|uniref:hypothetical protein n=1 Tax=Kitasatospora sp. NPDC096140 TaxID=3155425 RepID=UPI003325DC12
MREYSNLAWPGTPYGGSRRPFPRQRRLLTGFAVQWADDGENAVPLAAAAVFLSVHRTAVTVLDPATADAGYRVVVADGDLESSGVVDVVDQVLVQARRHSAGIGWHSYPDDAHALAARAVGRTPGITAVAEAWTDRTVCDRGTAQLTDTADDLGLTGRPVPLVAAEHNLRCPVGPGGLLTPPALQELYETNTPAKAAEDYGSSALVQALTVTLLAGHARELLSWPDGFNVGQLAATLAWDHFPTAFNTAPTAAAAQ